MIETTNTESKRRRPACGQCSGTGYVYLWAVARAGARTWFCDRCKRSWSDGEPNVAAPVGDRVGMPAAHPVRAAEQPPLEPAVDAEPDEPRPRRLRVIEPNVVRTARGPRVGHDAHTSEWSAPAPLPP